MPEKTASVLYLRLALCVMGLLCLLLTACGESAHISPKGEVVIGGSIGGKN